MNQYVLHSQYVHFPACYISIKSMRKTWPDYSLLWQMPLSLAEHLNTIVLPSSTHSVGVLLHVINRIASILVQEF